MAVVYLFVDESGDLELSPKGTKHFILASVCTDDCGLGDRLLRLRRDLMLQGADLPNGFHATSDKQRARDAVFQVLLTEDFRVDATIFEKPKAHPSLRDDVVKFYKNAWFFHVKYVVPRVTRAEDQLVVVGASITLNKKKTLAAEAIADVVGTTAGSLPFTTASWTAASDPCLQVADYCSWALFRKWEGMTSGRTV